MTEKIKTSGIPWVGEIPYDWETDELRYVFKQVKTPNLQGDENNLLSLSYGRIIQRDIESTIGLLPESFDTYNIIASNDIVLRLTDLQNDQKSLRVGYSEQRGIITSAYLTLRLLFNGDARYFYYLLHVYDLQKVFYGMGAGVRQSLSWDELKRVSIIYPNAETQKAIAVVIDRECKKIDQITNDIERQIGLLKDYKLTIISEVVTKGINKKRDLKESGIFSIGLIPDNWEIQRIKYVSHVFNGNSLNDDEKAQYEKVQYEKVESFPYIATKDVAYPTNIIDYDNGMEIPIKETRFRIAPQHSTLLCIEGGSAGRKMGYTDRPVTFVNKLAAFVAYEINPKYLYYFINSDSFRTIFQLNIAGLIGGVSIRDLIRFPVCVPPKIEQQEIVDYLDIECAKIEDIIKDKQEALETLKEYKKSLIYEYVTGKKRVKEAK